MVIVVLVGVCIIILLSLRSENTHSSIKVQKNCKKSEDEEFEDIFLNGAFGDDIDDFK